MNYNINLKKSIINLLFFLLSFTMVIFSTETLAYKNTLKVIVRIAILIPGLLIIIKDLKISKKLFYNMLFLFSIASFSLLNGINNLNNIIELLTLFYLILLINISGDPKNYYKSTLLGLFSSITLVILLVSVGIFENRVFIDQIGRVRNFFGFRNPNSLSLYVFSFSVLSILYKKSKKSIFISFILIMIVYFFTRSRTPFMEFLIFIFLIFFIGEKNRRIKYTILILLIYGTLLFYIYASIFYDSFQHLDMILSYRLSFINLFFHNMTYFDFIFGGNSFLITVDNSYLMILRNFGILFLTYLLIKIYFIRKKLFKFDKYEISFIITMLIFGFFEAVLISPGVPISIIFWYLILLKIN